MTHIDRLVADLSTVRGPLIAASAEGRVFVYLPELGDGLTLDSAQVKQTKRIFSPTGDPALELLIAGETLILTGSDVVFEPVPPSTLLDTPIRYMVQDAPALVAYSETERAAESIATASLSGQSNFDSFGGAYLMIRSFIAGATRWGLRPVRAVAWWQQGWSAVGEDIALPPFRADSTWDGLLAEATAVMLTRRARPDYGDGATAALPDFRRLKMNVLPLDDELVSAWRRWIPISPKAFDDTICAGLSDPLADVSLYPEGRGSIDISIKGKGLIQLRFLVPESEMTLDEIRLTDRGSGLFHRLMHNAATLACLLRLSKLTLHATGVGGYVFARHGHYPSLRQLPPQAR